MLGKNIKALRLSKGLSQQALAEQLHVVRQTVSKWESGLSVPDADLLIRLSQLLGVTPGELLGQELEPSAETAEQLAKRLADKCIKSGKSVRLEPMNPYERKVIHSALQSNPKVTTRSEGVEPNRRVVIELKR